jgi:hypothetical protein
MPSRVFKSVIQALLGRVWTDNETIQKHILVHKLSAVGFVQNKHRNKHRNKDWSYEQFDIIKKK